MSAEQHQLDIRASEPEEREDPRNRLLDAFEATIEALIANDMEGPLRLRLGRLLPPAAAAPGAQPDIERELQLAAVLTALSTVERFRKSKEHRALIDSARAFVAGELAALKAARGNTGNGGGK